MNALPPDSGSIRQLAQQRRQASTENGSKPLSITTSHRTSTAGENHTPTPPAVQPSPSSAGIEVSVVDGQRRSTNFSSKEGRIIKAVKFNETPPDGTPESSKVGGAMSTIADPSSPDSPKPSPNMQGRVVRKKPYFEIISNSVVGAASIVGGTAASIVSKTYHVVSFPMVIVGVFLIWNSRQFNRQSQENADDLRKKNKHLTKQAARYLKQIEKKDKEVARIKQEKDDFNNIGAEQLIRKHTESMEQQHQILDLKTQLNTSSHRIMALEQSDAGLNQQMLFEARYLVQEIENAAQRHNMKLTAEECEGLENTNDTIIRFKRAQKLLKKVYGAISQ